MRVAWVGKADVLLARGLSEVLARVDLGHAAVVA